MTWVSACASSNCVQVRRVGDMVEVRDSERPDETVWTPVADWDRFVAGVCSSEFAYLTAEWRTAETSSAPSGNVDPTDTETSPHSATEAHRAVSGLVVSHDHPAVQAVLDVTPLDLDGEVITGFDAADMPEYGPPAPLAAKQAAAVLRWLARDMGERFRWTTDMGELRALADVIDPPVPSAPAAPNQGDQQ